MGKKAQQSVESYSFAKDQLSPMEACPWIPLSQISTRQMAKHSPSLHLIQDAKRKSPPSILGLSHGKKSMESNLQLA